jgi:hypothetical protein
MNWEVAYGLQALLLRRGMAFTMQVTLEPYRESVYQYWRRRVWDFSCDCLPNMADAALLCRDIDDIQNMCREKNG